MKTAHLEALDLDIPLRRLQAMEDHGYVDSIKQFMEDKFRTVLYTRPEARRSALNGLCWVIGARFPFSKSPLIGKIHVLCRQGNDDDVNLVTKAHEETHVLQLLGKTDLLEKRYAELGFDVDLQSLGDEDAADVGSVYALLRRGELPLEMFRKDSYIRRALSLVDDNMYKELLRQVEDEHYLCPNQNS